MAAIIRKVDDVHLVTGQEVPADGTHRLVLDGQVVDLDLTNENFAQLENDLAPWFKVGTRPRHAAQAPATGSRKRGRAYNTGMRAWADERGYIYRNKDGKIQYPPALIRDYASYLADHGGSVTPGQ